MVLARSTSASAAADLSVSAENVSVPLLQPNETRVGVPTLLWWLGVVLFEVVGDFVPGGFRGHEDMRGRTQSRISLHTAGGHDDEVSARRFDRKRRATA